MMGDKAKKDSGKGGSHGSGSQQHTDPRHSVKPERVRKGVDDGKRQK